MQNNNYYARAETTAELMNQTEAEQVAMLARMAGEPKEIKPQTFLVKPDGTAFSLEFLQEKPNRIKISETFHDPQSWVEYVNKFRSQDTMLFMVNNEKSVAAILDYHSPAHPSWCTHRAEYIPRMNPNFRIWLDKNGQWLFQDVFAEFLELNTIKVTSHTAADLLEIATSLSATKSVVFRSSVKTQTGDVQFRYEEETTAGAGKTGDISVPSVIKIRCPIFDGAEDFEITMRLYFRIEDNRRLHFRFQIVELQRQLDLALESVLAKLEQAVGLKILK